MIRRNICPICGSENPEGSEYCQVCHVNLSNLPDEFFPNDPAPVENTIKETSAPKSIGVEELDLDSKIPEWLKNQLQHKEKTERRSMDFDSYMDGLFGAQSSERSASPTKVMMPQPQRKAAPVYQMQLEDIVEAPLLETESELEKALPENIPGLNDFVSLRPQKKWDDPQGSMIETVHEQTVKAFPAIQTIPPLWQQDAPLVELDENEDNAKAAEDDDPALLNSVSSMMVGAESIAVSTSTQSEAEAPALIADPEPRHPAYDIDEYQPESGSLLSDLMNEMNASSPSLTPQETKSKGEGTVFYSGNTPVEEPKAEEIKEDVVIPVADEHLSTAEALDQILRGIGYQVEGEAALLEESEALESAEQSDPRPNDKNTVPADDEPVVHPEENSPALIDMPDEEDYTEEDILPAKDAAYKVIPEKEDDLFEQDIPWDLFGTQDMSLPQSPEDNGYMTFSRSGIPNEEGNTTYQQRMMSSILGRIIHAENFVEPQQKNNARKVSIPARLFWSILAIVGVIVILRTGLTDRIGMPFMTNTEESEAFYQAAESVSGNALVVVDYTPAYSAELDVAAEGLLGTLEENADQVYLAALNPSAMPKTRRLLKEHADQVEFAGWWPAGVISIRSRIALDALPENIWLITSESGSLRDWAEQLTASDGSRQLHVLAVGQLEPLLSTYMQAGMVKTAMSRDRDLLHYGETVSDTSRADMAVLYLTVLIPLAWLGGVIMKSMKSVPNYDRKKAAKTEIPQYLEEKEPETDGRE